MRDPVQIALTRVREPMQDVDGGKTGRFPPLLDIAIFTRRWRFNTTGNDKEDRSARFAPRTAARTVEHQQRRWSSD